MHMHFSVRINALLQKRTLSDERSGIHIDQQPTDRQSHLYLTDYTSSSNLTSGPN